MNSMKVLLKKSTEDMNWGGDDYDVITLNLISKALLSASVVTFTIESPTIETIGNSKTNVSSSRSGL